MAPPVFRGRKREAVDLWWVFRPLWVWGAQLTVFDAAAALERAMEDLDSPTPGVPSHTLLGVLEAARLDRGEQHPFNGVLISSVLGLFTYIHGPRSNGRAVVQALGRLQVE